MPSAKSIAVEAGADSLHFILKNEPTIYLCFTSCDKESWIIHVTNGIDVWRLSLDHTNLESHRELAEVSSYEAYFLKFCQGFRSGDIKVAAQGHKVSLSVGSGASLFHYDLYEGTANERKEDLQRALFYFAEKCSSLTKELTRKQEELANMKKQKTDVSGQGNLLQEYDRKKQLGSQAKVVKQQGLSIVNPSSKKRKPAKGVEFE